MDKQNIYNLKGQQVNAAKFKQDNRVVSVTTATVALTDDLHGDKVIALNRAAGVTATLPAASGTGAIYRVVVGTTFSGGSGVIQVANSSDIIQGVVYQTQDAGATLQAFEAGAADDTLTLNGSSSGGIKGDRLDFIDIANNLWQCTAWTAATGSETSPWSSNV